MWQRRLATLLSCLALVLALACAASDPLTPEQEAVSELTSRLQQRLPPDVWADIERQEWYRGAQTGEDGVRLLKALFSLGRDAGPEDVRSLLEAFPAGLDEATASALERLARFWPRQELTERAWLRDGVDGDEAFLVDLIDRRNTFGLLLLRLLDRRPAWLLDGLDGAERRLLRLAGVAASSSLLDSLLSALEDGRYRTWSLDAGMPEPTAAVLVWSASISEGARRRAIDLVNDLSPRVAAFAGPFPGDTLLLVLSEESSLCSADARPGRGNPALPALEGQVEPGIITLAPGCLQPQTLAHELTHVFVGGRQPTWFAEGIADVASYHLTGRLGYAGGNGKLRLERRETDSSEPFVRSPYYQEAARGTAMLLQLYRLLGADALSRVLQAAGQEVRISGARALELILDQAPPEKLGEVQAVFARWIEGY